MTVLPPPPYTTGLVDKKGVISPVWLVWLNQLWQRVGQGNAPTPNDNNELIAYMESSNFTDRNVGNAENYIYNVRNYDIFPDGTNQTHAIQELLDSGIPELYFPADPDGGKAVYIANELTVRSGLVISGDGYGLSEISIPQENLDPNFRGWVVEGGLDNLTFTNVALRGNLLEQTSNDGNGQYGWGVWFRAGAITNLVFDGVKIYQWGQQGGVFGTRGGGAIGLGAADGENVAFENITIVNSVIGDCANVPGVYLSALGLADGDSAKNIIIKNNRFFLTLPYALQNMLYLVGYEDKLFRTFQFEGNTFDIQQLMDATIELNWTSDSIIAGNNWNLSGSGSCEGILLRSGINSCVIDSNAFSNTGSGAATRTAVSSVQFNPGETQSNFTITNNIIKDWGNTLISLASGTENGIIANNQLIGENLTPSYAISVANAENFSIYGNKIRNVAVPLNLGGSTGVDRIRFFDNDIEDCGQEDNYLISTPVTDIAGTNVYVARNTVIDPKVGSLGFWGCAFQQPVGNQLIENTLPDGFALYNPSYLSSLERIVYPPNTNGYVQTGRQYVFDQGAIDMIAYDPAIDWNDPMAQKSSYRIGSNVDAELPYCGPGDFVQFSYIGVLPEGVSLSSTVIGYGQARCDVTNVTSIDQTVPAGKWLVNIRNQSDYLSDGQLRISGQTYTVNGDTIVINGLRSA